MVSIFNSILENAKAYKGERSPVADISDYIYSLLKNSDPEILIESCYCRNYLKWGQTLKFLIYIWIFFYLINDNFVESPRKN